MIDEKIVKEQFSLLEKELKTLIRRTKELSAAQKKPEELKIETKGLKLFLGRVHPEFKSKFPELLQKLKL